MPKPSYIVTLHISIDDIVPSIWRRITVDMDITLRSLHHILQAAFGWTSSHRHEFQIRSATYAEPDSGTPGVIDDRKIKLNQVFEPGERFTYMYDLGDSWSHTIFVEKITAEAEKQGYGMVVDGARACPLEDSGGPYGYAELLETIKHAPQGPDALALLDWIGSDFDPETFDKRAANASLLRLAWNGWGRR